MSKGGETKYKFNYFNARGAGEICRLVFVAAGVDFEDVRRKDETWTDFRPKTPMKAMPVLEMNGELFCQSGAIARCIARKYGLMGSGDIDDFLCDEVMGCVQDAAQAYFKFAFEKDETRREQNETAFKKEAMPKLTDYIKKKLTNKGQNGFMIGNKLTLADLVVFNFSDFMTLRGEDVISTEMKTHHTKIGEIPKIKEWIAKRPKTEF